MVDAVVNQTNSLVATAHALVKVWFWTVKRIVVMVVMRLGRRGRSIVDTIAPMEVDQQFHIREKRVLRSQVVKVVILRRFVIPRMVHLLAT